MNAGTTRPKPTKSVQRFVAGLLAVLMLAGGPWFMLQTIAWARMIVTYSSDDSLGNALRKTFDGQHPCELCLQIQKGQQADHKQDCPPARERLERSFELCLSADPVSVPPVPVNHAGPIPFLDRYTDFVESPPTPPPRSTVAMRAWTPAS
jgi:hypothetical protein